MKAPQKTEQAGAGNTDPFDRKALVKAETRYQEASEATTASITKFPRQRQSLRRRASIRLSELYKLAQFRRHHGLSVSPNDFVFALAATLACGAPGQIIIRGRVNRAARLEARPHTIAWDGLSMATLREAISRSELGHFEEDELRTVIEAVRRFNDRCGPRLIRAEKLGSVLQMTSAERQECRIRTIDAVDEPRADRIERQAAEKRIRDREDKRAKRGRVPRAVYEAKSLSRTKPWEVERISRRTWYKRRPCTGVSPDDISSTHTATHLCTGVAPPKTQPEQGPARTGGDNQAVGADGPSPGGETIIVAAARSGCAAAFGGGGWEVGAPPLRQRIADPGEPLIPPLFGKTAQTVALIEAAAEILAGMADRLIDPTGMTIRGVQGALEGFCDLLWMVSEVHPEGVEETTRIAAQDAASVLRIAAANDNRITTLLEKLAG